jgi:mono/diheme cytochrome c family protein
MKAAAAALPLIALLGFSTGCGKPTGQAEQPEAVMDFHQLFSENCSACHGMSGQKGAGPRLNDPLYLALATKRDLYTVIEKGRPGTPMPAFAQSGGGPLAEKQIAAIIDGIEREWAKPVNLQGAALPVYSVANAPPGDARRGQAQYMRNCMMCHGFGSFKGAAGSITDPNYLALVSDQYLRTTAVVGRIDWGMPDWRHRIPGHVMNDQDLSDVVAWLASQRPKGYMMAQNQSTNHASSNPSSLGSGKEPNQ